MNRKERRARQRSREAGGVPGGQTSAAAPLLVEASRYQRQGDFDKASTLYRRALAIEPDNASALNNLACALLELGKHDEAAARFARALALVPELFEQYRDICDTLVRVNPVMGDAMARAAAAWPALLPASELLGIDGIAGTARDPLLRAMLASAIVRDSNLERVLTAVRTALLDVAAAGRASDRVDGNVLAFHCALARQCFINEYVFATLPAELERAERLKAELIDAVAASRPVPPLWVAAVGSYFPLGKLPFEQTLMDQTWPDPVAELLTQQIREPREEETFRPSILRLTPVDDAVSLSVMRQYEENPYPRWVHPPSRRPSVPVDDYLRTQFPAAAFRALGKSGYVDVLLAGCGTGGHSIAVAQRFKDVRLLAVDLSLASLAHAVRKTRAIGLSNIDYAQADILKLGSLGRTFDVIDASGVLHHLADPMEGWRVLLSLLRPGGVMRLGLYSALARRDVVAARDYIAAQGYGPTVDDIRRCRQELLDTPYRNLVRYNDFFSTSECRDLLFHVQEHRLDIPTIAAFLSDHGLTFIGFEDAPHVLRAYRDRYPGDTAMTDLGHWHAFEKAHPDTFFGMYQFWVQIN